MRNCFSPSTVTESSWVLPALLAVLLSLTLAGAGVRANPPGEPAGKKNFTRDAVFKLPIQIDDRARANIKEVHLYTKVPGGTWSLKEKASPSQPAFTFKAPHDGEYWFALVTVDFNDVATPSNLNHLNADEIVMVVVDTEKPAFDLQVLKAAGADQLRCVISDANPDYKSVKITYQDADHKVRALEAVPGQPGVFRVPGPDLFQQTLQVTVADLAGNTTSRRLQLTEEGVVAPTAQAPTPVSPPSLITPVGGVMPSHSGSELVQAVVHGAVMQGPEMAPHHDETPSGVVAHQLINTTRASIEYRIEQVGPSGVGKVEVWLTADGGKTWQLRGDNAERRSPVQFELPGEGLYGVYLAITNGNGFGGRAPQPGEQPQCWIEVDMSAPVVQLRDIEPVTNGSTIDIHWVANDKNLGAEPINLYFATRKEGPWQPLAHGLKNDGLYRWTFPRDLGAQFYVRVEATDMAGNVAHVDSTAAVMLDLTEPRASVTGVTGIRGH
jgi:Bacterial Ig-like domain